MPIPKFGIAEEVRVCESCWAKAGRGKVAAGWVICALSDKHAYMAYHSTAPSIPSRTLKSREDLDADLQRAIELSLAESRSSGSRYRGSEPPLARKAGTAQDDDEEMRLAIEASLRDMEARPSAPHGAEEPEFKVSIYVSILYFGLTSSS